MDTIIVISSRQTVLGNDSYIWKRFYSIYEHALEARRLDSNNTSCNGGFSLNMVDFGEGAGEPLNTGVVTAEDVRAAAANGAPGDISDCVVIVLAHSRSTTPAAVHSDDLEEPPVTCKPREGEEHTIRALQQYEGSPLLKYTVDCARSAEADAIYVVAPDDYEFYEPIAECAEEYGADGTLRLGSSKEAPDFFGIPQRALELASEIVADSGNHAGKHVIFIPCDMPRLQPHHLMALRQILEQHPQTQAVTSWIVWLRRLPILVTNSLIKELVGAEASGASTLPHSRPLPHFDVREAVFGEEMLATGTAFSPEFEKFFGGHPMSALEAVRMVRANEAAAAADGASSSKEPTGLSEADTRMYKAAKEVIAICDQLVGELDGASSVDSHDTTYSSASADRTGGDATSSGPNAASASFATELARADAASSGPNAAATTFSAELARADAFGKRAKINFPIFTDNRYKKTLVYLDSAATTQRCAQTVAAEQRFELGENANVYRGSYDLSMKATFTLNDARAVVEKFIGAKRRETIYTQNTSGGTSLVAEAWGEENIKRGDTIALCLSEHHSNMLPWMLLAKRKGARIVYIPYDGDGRIDREAYRQIMACKPALVCLAQESNVFGLENPIKELAAEAHAVGARVFVDGAQGLPHGSIDVRDLGADFYAFSGHKMYGPMGIGGLWVHPDVYDETVPFTSGGGAISHVSMEGFYSRKGAIAYEVGTPDVSAAVGFASAVELMNTLGDAEMEQHRKTLTKYLVEGMERVGGARILGDHTKGDGLSGLVSFTMDGVSPGEAGIVFGKLGVAVRSGGHCALPLSASLGIIGSARVSLGIYNTKEDIEAALVALRICRELYE